MRSISAFNFLTINGFYKGINEDISWHVHGEEGNQYSIDRLQSGNILLFGRVTYEMMYSFWPTETAYSLYPIVAEKMNSAEKLVVSNSLNSASWQNSKIISGDIISQISKLKNSPGKNISILGSGTLITSLTDAGLIDEYEFLIDPLAIGKGTLIFHNIQNTLRLELTGTRVFEKSGSILLNYNKI
ncbi:MAG: dihydrofolate reductase family protein [Saprospiraceae bacterium]|nr:dihydrofolate reductase family protein [Saprospiraceae bacterium]